MGPRREAAEWGIINRDPEGVRQEQIMWGPWTPGAIWLNSSCRYKVAKVNPKK